MQLEIESPSVGQPFQICPRCHDGEAFRSNCSYPITFRCCTRASVDRNRPHVNARNIRASRALAIPMKPMPRRDSGKRPPALDSWAARLQLLTNVGNASGCLWKSAGASAPCEPSAHDICKRIPLERLSPIHGYLKTPVKRFYTRQLILPKCRYRSFFSRHWRPLCDDRIAFTVL